MADALLHRSMEKVFANTEARVVAAYKVHSLFLSSSQARLNARSLHAASTHRSRSVFRALHPHFLLRKNLQRSVVHPVVSVLTHRTQSSDLWHSMQSKGKERVVCLTAERRTKRRGFKGSLHVCKVSSGIMQVDAPRHTQLTWVEAFETLSRNSRCMFDWRANSERWLKQGCAVFCRYRSHIC